MSSILYPFMVLAACGFGLSLSAHVLALAGLPIPGGKLVWALHIGIFVVWLPAVIVAHRVTRLSDRKKFWSVALAGCPAWMQRAVKIIFYYGICNFIIFFLWTAHGPKPVGDAPASVIRGFSGHWLIFYSAAFAMLYSAIHAPQLYRERKCPNGHAVSPYARFCPQCGYAFQEKTQVF